MITRTHNIKSTVIHCIQIALLLVFGIISTCSFFYDLKYINNREVAIVEAVTLLLAVLLWGVLYFEVRALTAVLYADDNGIGISRFGKTKVYLKWCDICDIGVGRIPTPYGYAKRMYLSDKKLDDDEKSDLITIRFHTVYFSHIPQSFADLIQKKCGLTIPEEAEKMVEKKNI